MSRENISADVLTQGGDYAPERIAGAEHVRQHGGEVIVPDRMAGASAAGLIAAIRGG